MARATAAATTTLVQTIAAQTSPGAPTAALMNPAVPTTTAVLTTTAVPTTNVAPKGAVAPMATAARAPPAALRVRVAREVGKADPPSPSAEDSPERRPAMRHFQKRRLGAPAYLHLGPNWSEAM